MRTHPEFPMHVTRRSFLKSASTLTLGSALAPGISLALEENPASTGNERVT